MESVEWSGFCEWKKSDCTIAIGYVNVNTFDVVQLTRHTRCRVCRVNVHTRDATTGASYGTVRYCPLRIHTPYMTPFETRSMRVAA